MAFTQSMLAGGGRQPKRPGSLTEMFGALPYIIGKGSEFLDSDGYGDHDDGDDTDLEVKQEAPEDLEASTEILLIPERMKGSEWIDSVFQKLLKKLADAGNIILVHKDTVIHMHNCNPIIMPDAPGLETDTELPLLIQSCCMAQNLLLTQGRDEALLYILTDLVQAIIDPRTPALKKAISRLHRSGDLAGNVIYQSIVKTAKQDLTNPEAVKGVTIAAILAKTTHDRSAENIEDLQQLLQGVLQSLLNTDPSILNGLKGSFWLNFDLGDTWNDLIIAQNLRELHASSEGIPVVFLGDITVIRRNTIQRLLQSSGIQTSENLENLPIDERLKEAKQMFINRSDFETAMAIMNALADTGSLQTATGIPALSTRRPVYLIGEQHYNQKDTAFRKLVEASEKRGLVIYGREFSPIIQSSTPEITRAHYLDDELAKALCSFNIAAAALEGVLRNETPPAEALTHTCDAFARIASASDKLLLNAIETLYNDMLFNGSELHDLTKTAQKDLVNMKVNTFEERGNTFWRAFQGNMNNEEWVSRLIYILNLMKALIINAQNERPEHKQLTEEQIRWQANNINAHDILIMSPWRDIFIAENIELLYLKSLKEDLPLVIILGSAHIDNIQRMLESRGILVSSNVMELPLESHSGPILAKRIKEEKQNRLENEIRKETEESLLRREIAIGRRNPDRLLDDIFGASI